MITVNTVTVNNRAVVSYRIIQNCRIPIVSLSDSEQSDFVCNSCTINKGCRDLLGMNWIIDHASNQDRRNI